MSEKAVTDFASATSVAQTDQFYLIQGSGIGSDKRATVAKVIEGGICSNANTPWVPDHDELASRATDFLLGSRAGTLKKWTLKQLAEAFGTEQVFVAPINGIVNLDTGVDGQQWSGNIVIVMNATVTALELTIMGTIPANTKMTIINQGWVPHSAVGSIAGYGIYTTPSGTNAKIYNHSIHTIQFALSNSTYYHQSIVYGNSSRVPVVSSVIYRDLGMGEVFLGAWVEPTESGTRTIVTYAGGRPALKGSDIMATRDCRVSSILLTVTLTNAIPAGKSITLKFTGLRVPFGLESGVVLPDTPNVVVNGPLNVIQAIFHPDDWNLSAGDRLSVFGYVVAHNLVANLTPIEGIACVEFVNPE